MEDEKDAVYLEYHKDKKQVVEIYEDKPETETGYGYVKTDQFKVGDEFEYTITVNNVNDKKELTSYSAIRNNPNAKRLLEENKELTEENESLANALLEIADKQSTDNEEVHNALLDLAEKAGGDN